MHLTVCVCLCHLQNLKGPISGEYSVHVVSIDQWETLQNLKGYLNSSLQLDMVLSSKSLLCPSLRHKKCHIIITIIYIALFSYNLLSFFSSIKLYLLVNIKYLDTICGRYDKQLCHCNICVNCSEHCILKRNEVVLF